MKNSISNSSSIAIIMMMMAKPKRDMTHLYTHAYDEENYSLGRQPIMLSLFIVTKRIRLVLCLFFVVWPVRKAFVCMYEWLCQRICAPNHNQTAAAAGTFLCIRDTAYDQRPLILRRGRGVKYIVDCAPIPMNSEGDIFGEARIKDKI